MTNPSTEEMIKKHDELENGVYLVEVFCRGVFVQHGIFTTSNKARAWMELLPQDMACVCAPFVLDMPDFGNIKRESMQ